MATLLPNGRQQFIDANGNPLAGGEVAYFIPSTSTPKDTWQDAEQTTLNTNPITLDASGECVAYGSGSYRQVVSDASGNLIWDKITADTAVGGLAWGGTSTGTPNAQVIAASSFSQQDGQQISFLVGAGLTNTGAMTVAPGGGSGIALLLDSPTGPANPIGGEFVAGNVVTLVYSSTRGAFLAPVPFGFIPSGVMWDFGGLTAPGGWALCYGQAVSRNTYAALFAAIGTAYGSGDGSTTFNLPDFRGRVAAGKDDMGGTPANRITNAIAGFVGTLLGAFGGNQSMQQHTHAVTDPGHIHTVAITGGGAGGGAGTFIGISSTVNTSTATTGISNQNTGAGASQNIQPTLIVTKIIKL